MSFSENSSLESVDEFEAWQSRVGQENQQIDRMLEDMLINSCNMFIGDQPPRARRRYRDTQREIGEARLMKDYFVDNPTYDETIFRRRFRMRRPLFCRIVDAVTANDEYFEQRTDATGRQGISSLQKCTGAMRVLAYGTSADAVDEYLRMSEATTKEALMNFVDGVISCFGDEYLRKPNKDDLTRLLYAADQRGFPGMIGSIDCMHWEWENCPNAWAGQYARRSGKPTIILEAVASYDLWIWHAFFGTSGLLNDINELHRSPVFDDILTGRAPKVSYIVNGHENSKAYYLTDDIYCNTRNSITSPTVLSESKLEQFCLGANLRADLISAMISAKLAD
ncbi:hypothetical protein OSB04_017730 [Centaurea solstitialis]|uniref:Nuclease HARBI1 n=1 Tax=Centaurea solstitialis TaxID=347529 RepID=A0AA38WIM5_9ASTR|nr:hypothetical protein OSB04_017730 [Centaurea solstitialis]